MQKLTKGFCSMQEVTECAETSCKAERAGAALRGLLSRVGRYSSDQFHTLSAAKVTSTLLQAS